MTAPTHYPADSGLYNVTLECHLTYAEFDELQIFFIALKKRKAEATDHWQLRAVAIPPTKSAPSTGKRSCPVTHPVLPSTVAYFPHFADPLSGNYQPLQIARIIAVSSIFPRHEPSQTAFRFRPLQRLPALRQEIGASNFSESASGVTTQAVRLLGRLCARNPAKIKFREIAVATCGK